MRVSRSARPILARPLAFPVFLLLATLPPPVHAAAPVIDFQPAPQATILGGPAIFTVIASGDAPLSYQWRKDGVDLSDGAGVVGAVTDALELSDVEPTDGGHYSAVVTSTSGSATSVDAALTVSLPQAGDMDFSFDPGSSINHQLQAVAVQPDGKVLIGGYFTSIHGAARGRIARLNADGTTDHTLLNGLVGADHPVLCLAVQPDGKVLIGGGFGLVNDVGRGRIARLNADGSLDTTFLNRLPGVIGNDVHSIAVQPDGRVLIGGDFTVVNGVSRNSIARLEADGSLDTTFLNGLAGSNSIVRSLVVQPDGRVLLGGGFTTVNGVSRNRIARLNADGSLDATFLNGLAGSNSSVRSLALQPDGRVLLGGGFTTVNGVTRNCIARLNADGSLDTTFLNGLVAAGANGIVYTLALQPDGRVLLGGQFATVNGVSRRRVARLEADGSLDTTFLNGLLGVDSLGVLSLALQPDGRVLIGGEFFTVNGASRDRIARLNADGGLDTTFLNGLAGANLFVLAVAVQPDGRVLIGGHFTRFHGEIRNRIVRLEADGSLDTTFLNGLAGANGPVRSLIVQPDGRVLLGGDFTTVNGVSRNRIARLNADGSLDTTFLNGPVGASAIVRSIALKPDGRVLIGGEFTMVNGMSRGRIARLEADGSLDTTFLSGLAGADGPVHSLVEQPDGRVLIGGEFTTVNGVSHGGIARLEADGSLDTTFLNGLAGANGPAYSLAVQPDGRLLIGGDFTLVNEVTRNHIARLNADGSLDTTFVNGLAGANGPVDSLAVQPDGRVLLGGQFNTIHGVSRNIIGRLNADGSLDATFLNSMAWVNTIVRATVLQSDGRVLIGGSFATVVARLFGTTPVAPSITSQPSSQTAHEGCCAVFHVEATGIPRDYRWRKNGSDLADGGNLSGASSATLVISGVSGADAGAYSVVVSNFLGIATSDDATLSVTALPQCQAGTCDPQLGCVLSAVADGTTCSDRNACTTSDTCQAGSCASVAAPDTDQDGFEDPCDNCPAHSNPDQARMPFEYTILAADMTTLIWSQDEDVEFVEGPLAGVATYAVLESGMLVTTQSLEMDGDPVPGEGFYYLVKLPTPCGSWQSTLGAELGRDASLP